MKKGMLFLLFLVGIFALAACQTTVTNGDDPDPREETVLEYIDSWDGSFANVRVMQESIMQSGTYTMTMVTEETRYDWWTDAEVLHQTEMKTRVYETAEETITETTITERRDGTVSMETTIYLTESAEKTSLYIDIMNMFGDDPAFMEAFGLQDGWMQIDIEDTLDHAIEMAFFELFIKEMVLNPPLDDDLDDIDALQEELLAMIDADAETANLDLRQKVEYLLELDVASFLSAVRAVDFDYLLERLDESDAGYALQEEFEYFETELRDAGFDYDTYYDMLVDEGFLALLDAIPAHEAELFFEETYVPLHIMAAIYQSDTPLNTFFVEVFREMQSELTEAFEEMVEEVPIFVAVPDFDAIIDFFDTVDFDEWYDEAQTFDFEALVFETLFGRGAALYDDLEEGPMKEFLSLFYDTVTTVMPLSAILFDYATLFEDLHRFEPFTNVGYLAEFADDVSIEMTEDYMVKKTFYVTVPMMNRVLDAMSEEMGEWLETYGDFDFVLGSIPEGEFEPYPISIVMDLEDESMMHVVMEDEMMTMRMTMQEEPVSITLPTITSNFTDFMHEFAAMGLFMETLEVLDLIDASGFEEGIYTLDDEVFAKFGWLPQVFDLEASTVTIEADDVLIDFVYRDGYDVFNEPVSKQLLFDVFDGPMDRDAITTLYGLINHDAFTMTRLMFMIFQYEELGYEYSDFLHLWHLDDIAYEMAEGSGVLYIYDEYDWDSNQIKSTVLPKLNQLDDTMHVYLMEYWYTYGSEIHIESHTALLVIEDGEVIEKLYDTFDIIDKLDDLLAGE